MKVILALALAAGLATPALAEDFAVLIDLGKKATIDLVIEKSGSTNSAEGGQSVTASFRYRQDIVAIKDGYRVTQTLVDVGGDVAGKESHEAVNVSRRIVFEADEDLTPRRILNLPEIMDRTEVAMGKVGFDSAQLKLAMTTLRSLSPESAAATLLQEQNVLSNVQMAGLDLGKPVSQKSQASNPLGGPPIDQIITAELKSIDKKAGVAVIDYRAALDPASARDSMVDAMKRFAPQQKLSTAELEAFKIENTMTCRYEMSLKTGLTTKVVCDHHSAANEGKNPNRRDEHWVITQTLAKP